MRTSNNATRIIAPSIALIIALLTGCENLPGLLRLSASPPAEGHGGSSPESFVTPTPTPTPSIGPTIPAIGTSVHWDDELIKNYRMELKIGTKYIYRRTYPSLNQESYFVDEIQGIDGDLVTYLRSGGRNDIGAEVINGEGYDPSVKTMSLSEFHSNLALGSMDWRVAGTETISVGGITYEHALKIEGVQTDSADPKVEFVHWLVLGKGCVKEEASWTYANGTKVFNYLELIHYSSP